MTTIEENRGYFTEIHRLTQCGNIDEARRMLTQESRFSSFPFYPLYLAICSREDDLELWERAISSLNVFGSSAELIFAIEKAADISRKGGDPKRFRSYLQRAEEVSQEIGDTRQHLQYLAMYANQLYLDGMIEDAQSLFHDVIIRAQKSSFPLLVIAEGAILSGILLSQQRWLAAVSLSVIMESASRERKNWIGVSCAIMTRASAWFAQGMQEACIRLLLETGRDFHEQGAVAALNLIKARLAEMRSLLGEERFHELCSQI